VPGQAIPQLRLALLLVVVAACGRSGLDDSLVDEGPADAAGASDHEASVPDGATLDRFVPEGSVDEASLLESSAPDGASPESSTSEASTSDGSSLCGPCLGCCSATGACEPGFLDTECGSAGAACVDCTMQGSGSTCDGALDPRACAAPTCPAPYGGCAATVTTAPPLVQNVCSPEDLANAGTACASAVECGGSSAGEPIEGGALDSAAGEGAVVDGAAACTVSSCPTGCCDAHGECQPGTDETACGNGGEACESCVALGFMGCDASQHACSSRVPQCVLETCPGCCIGTSCFAGTDPNDCGLGAVACQACKSQGLVCRNGGCTEPPTCNASNCSGCCDDDNVCQPGDTGGACGLGGSACTSCSASGETCQSQKCLCDPSTCKGCCDGNGTCQAGFLATACGGSGSGCVDCTTLQPAETCNGVLTPPACTFPSCPGSYANDAGSLTGGCTAPPTSPIVPTSVCSGDELANAAEACADGPYTTVCADFFSFELGQDPACGRCLQPFDGGYTGISACLAAYATAACNQTTGCYTDCVQQSCGACPDGESQWQCSGEGPCYAYFQATDSCDAPNMFPEAGLFCEGYNETFGGWLQVVGAHYCAAGLVLDAGAGAD
jgi:hypothetical protein